MAHAFAPVDSPPQNVPGASNRVSRTVASVAALIALDALSIVAAFNIAYHIRFETTLFEVITITPASQFLSMAVVSLLCACASFAASGLYLLQRGIAAVEYIGKLIGLTTLSFSFTVTIATLFLRIEVPHLATVIAWAVSVVFIVSERLIARRVIHVLRTRGHAELRVLLIGTGPSATAIVDRMLDNPKYGYKPVALLDEDGYERGQVIRGVPVVGTTDELEEMLAHHRIDEVIIALPSMSHERILELVTRIPSDGIDVQVAPDVLQLMTSPVTVDELAGVPLITVKRGALRGWNRIVKRAMDVIIALSVLVLFSPLMLIIAALVKVTSPGPALYSQERVGYNGYRFNIIKFRSMRADAERQGPGWTTRDDDRRTPLGAFLRRYSLDELPQFVNILLGDMSVVGPRPERPIYVERFQQMIPRYMERHNEKCGLTGWAQVNGLRGDTSVEERTRYDLYYVDNWSLMLDLRIIAFTLLRLLRDDSAY